MYLPIPFIAISILNHLPWSFISPLNNFPPSIYNNGQGSLGAMPAFLCSTWSISYSLYLFPVYLAHPFTHLEWSSKDSESTKTTLTLLDISLHKGLRLSWEPVNRIGQRRTVVSAIFHSFRCILAMNSFLFYFGLASLMEVKAILAILS